MVVIRIGLKVLVMFLVAEESGLGTDAVTTLLHGTVVMIVKDHLWKPFRATKSRVQVSKMFYIFAQMSETASWNDIIMYSNTYTFHHLSCLLMFPEYNHLKSCLHAITCVIYQTSQKGRFRVLNK